jgi:predicted nucleotidyltransferase
VSEPTPADKLLTSLQERAKELNCLYEVEQTLSQLDLPFDQACQSVVDAIPPGWQYPDVCRAMLEHSDRTYRSAPFEPSPWVLTADIVVQDQAVGTLSVYYIEERPREAIGPFLEEEERLIRTIADRLGHTILHHRLREMRERMESTSQLPPEARAWRAPIELLRRTDRDLFLRVARRLTNHLCWIGVDAAQELLQQTYGRSLGEDDELTGETNFPGRTRTFDLSRLLSGEPFELASEALGDDQILSLVEQWIQQDKASFLPKVLHSSRATLPDIAEAIRRFRLVMADGAELGDAALNGLRVPLIRRFLTEHLNFISIAKRYVEPGDFGDMLERVVHPVDSHGRIGGKGAGLFLAERILSQAAEDGLDIGEFKVPKTWYLASDGLMSFIMRNELEEVLQHKYRDIAQLRREYDNIVQLFKHSRFPSEIVKGLSLALEDFGDTPLIVRSSSLLEDRLGSAFSGKYKSLFVPNTGTKHERLAALLDAIAEVYASLFGPDPIEYRRERGLLDFHEAMAVLIQEVVGERVGRYFLPAFAGVAFSNNEFRWSPKIRREDGLIRMVPGLGTRAVDRVSDDYPILAVPGQPALRVNASIDEQVRYTPHEVDVIDLETGRFVTLPLRQLVREVGTEFPAFDQVFSLLRDDMLTRPSRMLVDPARDDLVATLDGVLSSTRFVGQIDTWLKALEDSMGTPVDIEFAADGRHVYLLQCRPQSYSGEDAPAPIPRDLPEQDVLFAAHRYVSNGWVPDITHIVYVDPDAYARLPSSDQLKAVGRVVGRLNKLLPKRRFILMGPGRWGSRGDIKLGVSVTYSDINNTSMLVEIARRRGDYRPDLSFGTHFFQDLVEASIRYLPLYPDDDSRLNERFLLSAPNLLSSMVEEFASLEHTVRVIDVPAATGGSVLRVLMNADLDEAVGVLAEPDGVLVAEPGGARPQRTAQPDTYWQWRLQMAERIAGEIDPERFGVVAAYVIGSTKNANAGPDSDIDLLVHIRGSERQRQELMHWLEGWSLCLAEVNFQRTGYRQPDLLDVHLVTDEDIERRTSFAVKIGAVTDAARELPLGRPPTS